MIFDIYVSRIIVLVQEKLTPQKLYFNIGVVILSSDSRFISRVNPELQLTVAAQSLKRLSFSLSW